MAKPDNPQYPIIGQLALKHSLITKEDLEMALEKCGKGNDPALADYLLEQKLVSATDMKRLTTASRAMEIRERDIRFGAIAIENRYISNSLLKLALDEQKMELTRNKRSKLLGDILVEACMITKDQRDNILKKQNRIKELNRLPQKPTGHLKQEAEEQITVSQESQNLNTATILERGMKLTISQDTITAFISKTDDFDDNITLHDIKYILRSQGIIFGIVDDTLIQGFIDSRGFKTKPFKIAMGVEPQKGADASITYFFDTDRLKVGKISSKGTIDFKERGDIPRVAALDVLAEKKPPVEGCDGKNVFGETTVVTPAKDIKMKYGKGARASEDGLKIIAQIDGQPKLSWAGMISVLDEFTAENVDYESGHIDYQGNVKIKGCVQSGFKVSGENIRAAEIDGGIIHAEGDLSVAGGINEAVIYAKGNVWAKFIHKSTILCMGDLYANKEIVESTIENSGACVINQGKIIASTINSKMGIYACNIGTERSISTTLKVGVDTFMEKELAKLKKTITGNQQKLLKAKEKKAELELAVKVEHKTTSQLAHMQEKSLASQKEAMTQTALLRNPEDQEKLNDMRAVLQNMKKEAATVEDDLNHSFKTLEMLENNLNRFIKEINVLKEELRSNLKERENIEKWARENPGLAIVDVSQTLTAGTRIIGRHSETTIEKTLKKAKIKELMYTSPGKEDDQGWWEMRITPF